MVLKLNTYIPDQFQTSDRGDILTRLEGFVNHSLLPQLSKNIALLRAFNISSASFPFIFCIFHWCQV